MHSDIQTKTFIVLNCKCHIIKRDIMNYSIDREATFRMLKRPEYCGKWDAVKVIGDIYFGQV